MDMTGVSFNVDTRSAVYGGVGGILVGGLLSGLLVRHVTLRQAKAREEALADDFQALMDSEYAAREDDIRERTEIRVANALAREYQPSDVDEDFVGEVASGTGGGSSSEAGATQYNIRSRVVDIPEALVPENLDIAQKVSDFLDRNAATTVAELAGGGLHADDPDDDDGGPDADADDDGAEVRHGNIFALAEDPVGIVIASPHPHMINRAEFGEIPGWVEATIRYFEEDSILVDDRYEPINDVLTLVGSDIRDKFGLDLEDPNVVLIRCPRLETDFEVCLEKGSYAEYVGLNGLPLKQPQSRIIRREDREQP